MDNVQIAILMQAVTMLFMMGLVVVALFRQGVKPADELLIRELQKMQNDPDRMRQIEKLYTHAGTMMQATLNVTTEVIKILAPLTSIKSDDALAKWLEDLRVPGPPDDDDVTVNLSIDTGTSDEVVKG